MLSSHTFTIQRLQYLGHKYKCGLATADIRGKSSEAGCGYGELLWPGSHSADLLGTVCLTTDTYSLRIT